jgi:hypothetical protein
MRTSVLVCSADVNLFDGNITKEGYRKEKLRDNIRHYCGGVSYR